MTLTWRELLGPLYVLAFVEGFLMAAIPGGGLTHAAENGRAALLTGPSWVSILVALGLGVLNGIRRVQALAAPPPGAIEPTAAGGKA